MAGPIRGDLLGAEHLAERARDVARKQRIAPPHDERRDARLLARLTSTRRILADAYQRLDVVHGSGGDIGPAGEWLLDNYHVVQEHIREVHESLPRGYYRELPQLARGPLKGYPRVYELTISLISHSEGRIDLENTDLFVSAFQEISSLSIGELWAIPAMLRLGLIESVRRMALRSVQRLDEMSQADDWVTRIQAASEEGAASLGATLADFASAPHVLTPIFVSRFLRGLRAVAGEFPPLIWLDRWIAEEGISPDDAATRTTERLALTQIMMANSITSLRAIGRRDWRTFVERQSTMEAILRRDPAGFYSAMTFTTRDHCRHVVERIAKRAKLTEGAVAQKAIELAHATDAADPDVTRRAHVGYYLIDSGRAELERVTGYRPNAGEAIHRWVLRHPNVVFVGGVILMSLASLAVLLWSSLPDARAVWWLVIVFGLIPTNDIGISVTNQLVTAFLRPRPLPRLDLTEHGVPEEYRTAVVIPTLFGSVEAVRDALENLEVQFLANREAHLHFAVLSDFNDALTECTNADTAIVEAAVQGVRTLNDRYAPTSRDAFFLFHRRRLWNPQQGVWMGWERKRGKLAQFNRYLRGATKQAFSTIEGNVEPLQHVRYVITLDSDTMLPPDTAPDLVGTLAHPLNRAYYDAASGRVVRGYSILQPRVGVSLPSAHRSQFAAIHSGHPGVDPYTTAVSDVYQDLYGEGSFTGKGIYDVDAFELATNGRFPANTLLSHDLIEGSYARAGLATDVTVYDDYPMRYLTYTRRKHRWIRGDWQLLQWLTSRVPGPDGLEPNRLPLLSRWKILDNLRRSTVEIAQLAFLVAGWTVLPGSPLRWTALALAAIAAPWLTALLLAIVQPPLDKSWRAYYAAVGQDVVTSAQQIGLAIAFLPHQAWVSADAILRTLWRLFVSHRNLLEWQTASQTEEVTSGEARAVWRAMRPAVILAAVILFGVIGLELARSNAMPADAESSRTAFSRLMLLAIAMAPLIGVWLGSPALAHSLSTPAETRGRRLGPVARLAAMRYALLHWHFFDRFVSVQTNALAPDNYQDHPLPQVAMRTSPTNIGLQLLATVSAHDLGFLTTEDLVRRLELTFRSLERLRRHRGHFFNWYDLHDLHVLEPEYISAVDSGNLAGHFIALREACLTLPDDPIFGRQVWLALEASLRIAQERLRALAGPTRVDLPSELTALLRAEDQLRRVRERVTVLARAAADLENANSPSLPRARALAAASESLSAVAESLAKARSAVNDVHLAALEVEPATEWLGWSQRLIAEHIAGLQLLSAHWPYAEGAPEPREAEQPPFITLREAATSWPAAGDLVARLQAIADRAYTYTMEMDFAYLYDNSRKLLTVGVNVSSRTFDGSHYDLLASEARLASFVAIAKNDVPVDHWFRLGRTLTHAAGETAMVSWSGSMFEYLMPLLVMRSFPHTALDATYRSAVRRQMTYGIERGVPWGVSECAYNVRDRQLTYQYRAFGVPDLALKRGLWRDLVVAPYATALAIMVDPEAALQNLAVLERKGGLGPFGFTDAIDYTRPPPGQRFAIVHTYMAHHIAMSVIALTNALLGQRWQRRFHSNPMVQSADLLLHERVPRRLVMQEPQATRPDKAMPDADVERSAVREVDTPDTPQPHVGLLGHLPYTIMVTHSGAGYSRYEGRDVTRWRSDATAGNSGQFCYLKRIGSPRVWSASHLPTGARADWYRALLAADRVSFHRADGPIETRTEIVVVSEDSAEVRQVTVVNNGDEPCEIELTSYGEIVLAPPESDRAHPAFSKLFVETEWHEWCTAITATRRPRSASDPSLWCVHVVDSGADRAGPVTFETDRARFLGRGRTVRDPAALDSDGPLSGTAGAVLDPIFALRTRVRLKPGRSTSVTFTTLVAASRERAFELAGRYHDSHAAQRALDLAWTSSQIELRELGTTSTESATFQELAGHLLFPKPSLRNRPAELRRNRGSQDRLWTYGISGDLPILLATVESGEGLPTLRQLFAAHRYWRRRALLVDLVILNGQTSTYLQELNEQITELMFTSGNSGAVDQPGGVFVRRRDQISADDLLLLSSTARVHIPCDGRSLGRILDAALAPTDEDEEESELPEEPVRRQERSTPPSSTVVQRFRTRLSNAIAMVTTSSPWTGVTESRRTTPVGTLCFDNGIGGLTPDNDYVIRVQGDRLPPAPWVNVVANPSGGFLVSERGAGFTWAANSYFFRLTPWHNDPVSDPPGDVLYLRDEESGDLWSATPAPFRNTALYSVRHGAGSSSFDHEHNGIATRLSLGMAGDDAVRLSLLRVTNDDGRSRRISVTAYVEWTLGVIREQTQHTVRTRFDGNHGAILAFNHFDPNYSQWVAFCALSEPVVSHTGDRREFLGVNGTLTNPAALRGRPLSGTTGVGLDPCAALQCVLKLEAGETREIAVLLGAAPNLGEAQRMLGEYRAVDRGGSAVVRSVAQWSDRLSVITVHTPEPAFDAMVNRWTLYQALACRMWARAALYQNSGAYGFRDQLQDVMAFVYAEPGLAREHIVRSAARQFIEGDVQHWWHPPSGRGIRSRFSDDLVWLPYVVDHYVRITGDRSVLDVDAPYLTMRQLKPDEQEVYDQPQESEEHGTVYEHCVRALHKACTCGVHGLPLMGSGDWNDGMNRVGVEGRGESVWLAWFLVTTLRAFAPHAEARGDAATALELRRRADAYAAATEAHGWDGEWYRRAYYDDGTPLGTSEATECRIDSIAQSWSVMSGAGAPERQAQAMRSLQTYLVREDARVLMLLTPPFDTTPNDPGYIKGYLPGVRENGAQYTHAALWAVLATAMLGDGERAFALYQMINPLTHSATAEDVARYKVEPYVVAADVYTAPSHMGRGGWTWYTGSASWMYRVGLESILGFRKLGDSLRLEPCVPDAWPSFTIEYRFGRSAYTIAVERPADVRRRGAEVVLDGRTLATPVIPLADDGKRHAVTVRPVTAA